MLELSYRKILSIATPLMFGTLVQSIIIVTDGIFVSELGTVAFDAVGNGGILYMSLFMLCRGIGDGTQIIIARKLGEGKQTEIGETLFNALFLQAILAAFIFVIFFAFGQLLIGAMSSSDEIATSMVEFIKYRSWGIFFAAFMVTMSAFFIGLGRTRIIIASTLILAGSNIFLDYGLIFGEFGLPELGMIGAPLASSIAEVLAFSFLFIYALNSKAFKEYAFRLKQRIVKKSRALAVLKLSYPLMFQGLISLATWLVFFTLIENMGEAELEASQTVRYCYFIAFIPLFGFGATTKTFVSNLVGQNRWDLIPKAQIKIALMSLLFIAIFFHGVYLYPEKIVQLVNHNQNIDPQVFQWSVDILTFVGGSMFIFSVVIVLLNSVAAIGHTKMSFVIDMTAIIIYVICCYLFIVRWKWDVVSIWWVEYIYFILLGVFSLAYLLYHRRFIKQKPRTD